MPGVHAAANERHVVVTGVTASAGVSVILSQAYYQSSGSFSFDVLYALNSDLDTYFHAVGSTQSYTGTERYLYYYF
jgi:hypothetical protein